MGREKEEKSTNEMAKLTSSWSGRHKRRWWHPRDSYSATHINFFPSDQAYI